MDEGRRMPFGMEFGPDLDAETYTLLLRVPNEGLPAFREGLKVEKPLRAAEDAIGEVIGHPVALYFDRDQKEVALLERVSSHGAQLVHDRYPTTRRRDNSERTLEIEQLAETDLDLCHEAARIIRDSRIKAGATPTFITMCARVLLTLRDLDERAQNEPGFAKNWPREALIEGAATDHPPTEDEIIRLLDEDYGFFGGCQVTEGSTLRAAMDKICFGLLVEFATAAQDAIEAARS